MTITSLLKLVARNVGRSKKNFLMSGIGIIVGISSFVFFIGLSEGIKQVVLGRIFLVDQVEVVAKRFDAGAGALLNLSGGRPLDASVADELKALEGVVDVFPKMKFTFPTRGFGGKGLFGRDIYAELVADGLEPRLVAESLGEDADQFADLEAERTCKAAADCLTGQACEAGLCQGIACKYDQATRLNVCPGDSYCAKDTKRCEQPIPVLISDHLIELYNGSLATALGGGKTKMPRLSKSMVKGFQLWAEFNKSFIDRSRGKGAITRRLKLVGFSDKAISVGVTLPLAYVRRLNRRYRGAEAAATYHSVILQVSDQTRVPAIVKAVKAKGFDLASKTENAERAADIIKTVESVFALVSFVIVGIAAINISQMFFMIIYQRKREIGLLRALGASRTDIRLMILGEAGLIGLTGGLSGIAAGIGASRLADYVASRLPEFPYKPESFFEFPAWLWITAVLGAVLFCLFGAFFPANTAARQQPATALTQ
jgi:ABC-type antimicrobial peptide transport system permease subunit